jgi:hypothetical protein
MKQKDSSVISFFFLPHLLGTETFSEKPFMGLSAKKSRLSVQEWKTKTGI